YEEGKKRRKPNYSSVDLSEVEWEDRDDVFRCGALQRPWEIFLPRERLHDLEHPDVSLADEWSYCNTDLHPEHRHLSQLEAIKLYLKGKEPLLQ
ncbi:hypothetical protein Celaphus_00010437, partial [Cervus elaphus hippelaphus]